VISPTAKYTSDRPFMDTFNTRIHKDITRNRFGGPLQLCVSVEALTSLGVRGAADSERLIYNRAPLVFASQICLVRRNLDPEMIVMDRMTTS
jgi:hypothetical protein